jgi:hypothetical protein
MLVRGKLSAKLYLCATLNLGSDGSPGSGSGVFDTGRVNVVLDMMLAATSRLVCVNWHSLSMP